MLQYRTSLFAVLLFSQAAVSFAQGPVGNTIYVKLDRNAMVGSRMLPPGDYTIREVTSASNPRVLEFTTNRGTKLVTTVTALPLLQNTPPSTTKIVFDNESVEPRISKIWVQGKEYGYKFPKESSVQSAKANEMQLRYDVPTAVIAEQPAAPVQVAQAPPAARPEPQAQTPTVVAQAAPPAAPAAEARPTQEIAQAQPPQAPVNSADSAAANQRSSDIEIPSTGLGWGNLLLMSLAFASAGLILLRRTA